MNSANRDLTKVHHCGTVCIWMMQREMSKSIVNFRSACQGKTLVRDYDPNSSDLDNRLLMLELQAKCIESLAASLANDCSPRHVYDDLVNQEVLSIFGSEKTLNAWQNYCSELAKLVNLPLCLGSHFNETHLVH